MLNEIPLIKGSQKMKIALNNIPYNLQFIWRGEVYVLNIFDNFMNPILLGVSVVTNNDILSCFEHLGLKGKLQILNNTMLDPTYNTLGIDDHLIFTSI